MSQSARAQVAAEDVVPHDLASILQPIAADRFLANDYGQKFVHIPGTPGKFSALLPWPVLNDILEHKVLGREFKLVGRTGRGWSRHDWLEKAAGPYEIDEFAFEEIDVDVYGDTAVLHSRYRQTAQLDGADLSHTFVLTDVWVRRAGRWQLVHRHSTIDPNE